MVGVGKGEEKMNMEEEGKEGEEEKMNVGEEGEEEMVGVGKEGEEIVNVGEEIVNVGEEGEEEMSTGKEMVDVGKGEDMTSAREVIEVWETWEIRKTVKKTNGWS